MGTNGSRQEGVGQRNICWDNLTLESPDIGSSLEDQLSGLRTRVSDLEHGGTAMNNDQELRGVSKQLKALNQKVSDLLDASSSKGSTASTIRHINVL